MRFGKVTKVMAALFAGAMMLLPMSVSAYSYNGGYGTHEVMPGIEAVSGFSVAAENGTVYARWNNTLYDYEYNESDNSRTDKAIRIEYSTDPAFPDDNYKTGSVYRDYGSETELGSLRPGLTYYVRAFIDYDYNSYVDDSKDKSGYGPYTATLQVTAPVPDVYFNEIKVTGNSVYFNFSNSDVTGYEIYRSTGTKYTKVAKISDTVYTDSGLEGGKSYNYKIRAYVYDPITKKTANGEWSYTTQTTWGQNFRLLAVPASKNSVKLTWKKVSGASGYEIYRYAGGSSGLPSVSGYSNNFSGYKLIKTINKAKTVKYTDKKLTPGASYTYMVVAFKNKAGKKVKELSISSSTSVSLDLQMSVYNTVRKKDGSLQIKWKKVIGASGYKIEKYDSKTSKWNAYTTLKASATSYTLPKAVSTDSDDQYRIYAYQGTRKSDVWDDLYTYNYSLDPAMPGGVRAVAANGGTAVTVSWSPVAGASYYRVFRARRLLKYNADMGNYDYYESPGNEYVEIQTSTEQWGTYKIRTNSVTDQYLEYKPAGSDKAYVVNDGPQLGVTYYYYVRAYKSNGKPVDDADYDEDAYSSWLGAPAKIALNNVSVKAPKLSSVKSKKAKQVTVSWKKAAGAKSYYVYYSTKKNKGFQLAGVTSKASFTVKGLKSGKKYFFKVKSCTTNAVGADCLSGFSGAKNVKVK